MTRRTFKCEMCEKKRETNNYRTRFCSFKCRVREQQRRRRRRLRSSAPTTIFSRSKEEEDFANLLVPLGYVWNKKVVQYKEGLRTRRFLLDFALEDNKVNIEVDGAAHRGTRAQAKDKRRDEILRQIGWKIIRIRLYERLWTSSNALAAHLDPRIRFRLPIP